MVSDLRMPLMDGIQLLEKVKQLRPEQVVLVVTAHGSIPTAVQAMKKGAFHCPLQTAFSGDGFFISAAVAARNLSTNRSY